MLNYLAHCLYRGRNLLLSQLDVPCFEACPFEYRQRRIWWIGNGEVEGSEGERTGGNKGGETVGSMQNKGKDVNKNNI